MFYGRMALPSRVGRSGFFFFSGSKSDSKNTKISRKIGLFLQKNFVKIFWLIFKKIQPKFLDFGQKPADFTRFWK